MNRVLAELSVPRPDRHLHLLQYAPRSGGQPRVFGAVWMDQQRLRWASPLVHWLDGFFNPQPFMVRFQDAIHEVALFEEAIVWLDAVCYAAAGPSEVQQACLGPLDWGLSCFEYSELSRTGTDLAGLLGEHPDPAILSPELQTACVIASLEHLVKGHRLFASTALEPVHGEPFECARLHCPGIGASGSASIHRRATATQWPEPAGARSPARSSRQSGPVSVGSAPPAGPNAGRFDGSRHRDGLVVRCHGGRAASTHGPLNTT